MTPARLQTGRCGPPPHRRRCSPTRRLRRQAQPLPGPADVNAFIKQLNEEYERAHVEYEKVRPGHCVVGDARMLA